MQEAQEQIQGTVFLLNLCFTLPTDSRVTKIYHNMTTTKASKDKEYWKENRKNKKWNHRSAAIVFAWAAGSLVRDMRGPFDYQPPWSLDLLCSD